MSGRNGQAASRRRHAHHVRNRYVLVHERGCVLSRGRVSKSSSFGALGTTQLARLTAHWTHLSYVRILMRKNYALYIGFRAIYGFKDVGRRHAAPSAVTWVQIDQSHNTLFWQVCLYVLDGAHGRTIQTVLPEHVRCDKTSFAIHSPCYLL